MIRVLFSRVDHRLRRSNGSNLLIGHPSFVGPTVRQRNPRRVFPNGPVGFRVYGPFACSASGSRALSGVPCQARASGWRFNRGGFVEVTSSTRGWWLGSDFTGDSVNWSCGVRRRPARGAGVGVRSGSGLLSAEGLRMLCVARGAMCFAPVLFLRVVGCGYFRMVVVGGSVCVGVFMLVFSVDGE